MVVIEVHRQPLYKRHYSNACSETGVFCVLQGFLLVFLPLIIAFSSGGSEHFWNANAFFISQPIVQYAYKAIVEYRGLDTATATPISLSASSSSFISSLALQTSRQAVFESMRRDDNNDGITDSFSFRIELPLKPSERILGFTALLFFETDIKGQVTYNFDSLAYVSHDSAVPLTSVSVDGEYLLRQGDVLQSKGGTHTPYLGYELLPTTFTSRLSSTRFAVPYIASQYASRNISMQFSPSVVSSVQAPSKPVLGNDAPSFVASVTLRIPVQSIRYRAPASQMLKDAWIQYMAFFLVVWFLLFRLSSFLFSHKLIRSFAVDDVRVTKTA